MPGFLIGLLTSCLPISRIPFHAVTREGVREELSRWWATRRLCQNAPASIALPGNASDNCPGTLFFPFPRSARETFCFSTCSTVDGVPFSGSLRSKWTCSGITT